MIAGLWCRCYHVFYILGCVYHLGWCCAWLLKPVVCNDDVGNVFNCLLAIDFFFLVVVWVHFTGPISLQSIQLSISIFQTTSALFKCVDVDIASQMMWKESFLRGFVLYYPRFKS